MDLEILYVEPIYPQYSGVLETILALKYWFFEVPGSESVNTVSASLWNFWCDFDIISYINLSL